MTLIFGVEYEWLSPFFDVFLYFFIKICYNIKKDKKIITHFEIFPYYYL